MMKKCSQCGEENSSSGSERTGTFTNVKATTFTCKKCGASGTINTHPRAGVISRTGAYFEDN